MTPRWLLCAFVAVAACGTRTREHHPREARGRNARPVAPSDAGAGGAPDAGADARIPDGPIPAWGGLLAGGRLVVLEPDLLALRAIDLAGRRTLWRTAFRAQAAGAVGLELLSERVIYVHAGNTVALLDLDSGAIRATRATLWNEVEHRAGLWRAPGLCAIRSECSMQLADCADLRPIGAPLAGQVVRRYPLVKGRLTTFHHTGCWGWSPFLLGRAADLVISTTDRRTSDPPASAASTVGRHVTVALDAATGREAWMSDRVTCMQCEERASGVSPDGRTCWLGEVEGTVRVFDCATGRLRFRAGLPPTATTTGRTEYDAITSWSDRGVVVSVPPRAVLHEPVSGRALWSRPVPARTMVVPIGGRIRDEVLAPDHARTLLLVDPATGEERARATLPRGARLLGTADGGLRIEGTPQAWAADGTALAGPPPPAPAAFEVERGNDRTVVRPAGGGAALLDEPVDGESLGELSLAGRPCVVLRLVPADRAGEIRVVCR